MQTNLYLFDSERYLDSKGISYSHSGKNVSSGWIGMECPFCPDGDPSDHLGVDIHNGGISCWRCGTKGSILKLVMKLERCDFETGKKIVNKFSHDLGQSLHDSIPEQRIDFSLPELTVDSLLPDHAEYLRLRNYDPVKLAHEYNLMSSDFTGDWKHRIIIPIYMRKKLVCFTSRDITGIARSPYVNCPNNRALIQAKNCLYNIDTVSSTAIIVEGPADVWRIGSGCVALLGVKYTHAQLWLLRGIRRAFVMFDADKQDKGEELASALSTFIHDVYNIQMKKDDPGKLLETTVNELRREIFG